MRFKGYLLTVAALMFFQAANSQGITVDNLRGRVNDIRQEGTSRAPGSDEGKATAEYIAGVFEEAGLQPFYAGDYIDDFTSEPLVGNARKTYRNVAGIIYGSDFTLDGEYIVIGAHYDYMGQNDNLSGVAALLELAYSLKGCSPGRNIIIAAFDGFELGLLGSRRFMAESTVPAENICLMVNLQGVGCFESREVLSYFVRNMGQKGVDHFLLPVPYEISVNWNGYKGRTDTEPFTSANIPTIHISTCPEVTGEMVTDYTLLNNVTQLVSDAVCNVANAQAFDRPVEKKAKGPLFEGGITAAAGSSFVRQSEGGGMRGKTMFSYSAGLYGQVNVSSFGLRPEVQFVRSGSRYEGGNIHMNSIVVPLNLVVQTPPVLPVAIHIYAGGYYRYTFGGKYAGDDMDFSNTWYRNGAGIQWGIGLRLKSFGIGVNNRYGLTDMLRNNDNKMTERATYCTLSYTF